MGPGSSRREADGRGGSGAVAGAAAGGAAGTALLHALIGEHLDEDARNAEVLIGIETDCGRWVAALIAAGYAVFPVSPLQTSRYRQRHSVSGAESDGADAHILADMVRTDSHQLSRASRDSADAEAIKVLHSVRDFARKEWPLRGNPADVRCHGVLRSAGG